MKKLITPSTTLKVLAAFSVLPIMIRVATTGEFTGLFLVWNLFLAWLPLPLARGFAKTFRAEASWLRLFMAGILFIWWLLFFPNAPYIVTDLIHLDGNHNPHYWLESIVLFSIAMTGLFTGIYSMYLVHKRIESVTGKLFALTVMVGCSFLSGFGIYLGRVQRWNTWDIITQPTALLRGAYHAVQEPLALEMTIGFGLLVIICYFMLLSLLQYEKHSG
ncbi:MAG: DUF1361 domain-containing protein [Cyclobacteriaceae bacterium]